jgi:outer membrane protein assembly factor BamB
VAGASAPCPPLMPVHTPLRDPVSRGPARRPPVVALALLALLAASACGSIARPEGWAAPALAGTTLYVSLAHGKLTAVQLGDPPRQLWEFPAKDEKLPVVVEGGRTLASPKMTKVTFEGLYGDPIVTADTVYLTAYSGHVAAVNREDGRARWVAALPGRVVGGALLEGDRLYVGTTEGDLFALDRGSGAVQWRRSPASEIWSTPVLAAGQIVVTGMDGTVTALTADGTTRWRRKLAGAAIASTPAVQGDRLYVGAFDKRFYAVDAATGELVWRSRPADNWFWTQAVVAGDRVYAGSLGGTLYAFPLEGSGLELAPTWARKLDSMIRSRPVLVNGVLVVGTREGRLFGLRPEDGTFAWEVSGTPAADDPAAPRGDLFADLLAADSRVYVATEHLRKDGNLYVFDLATRRVTEVRLKS